MEGLSLALSKQRLVPSLYRAIFTPFSLWGGWGFFLRCIVLNRIIVINVDNLPCSSDLTDNHGFDGELCITKYDKLMIYFLQGAFGKGALIGYGLTTYTLLGLGVVKFLFAYSFYCDYDALASLVHVAFLFTLLIV